MSLQELNFSGGARWVLTRSPSPATEGDLVVALHGLAHAACRTEADCEVSELFPDSPLVVLFSRDLDSGESPPALPPIPAKVTLDALRAIGAAIGYEMAATKTTLLRYSIAGIGEITIYQPEHRDTALLGTRTTLLSS